MKNKFLTFMAAFLLMANILLANTGETMVPESVAAAFNNNFSYATEVRNDNQHWQVYGREIKA